MLVDECPTGMPKTLSQNENDDFILQYGGNDDCVNIISPQQQNNSEIDGTPQGSNNECVLDLRGAIEEQENNQLDSNEFQSQNYILNQ